MQAQSCQAYHRNTALLRSFPEHFVDLAARGEVYVLGSAVSLGMLGKLMDQRQVLSCSTNVSRAAARYALHVQPLAFN